jgi:hypothetical protein
MLRNPSDDPVKYCYYQAALAREQAMRARSSPRKADLLETEERWIRLAQWYEMTETLADFEPEIRRFLGK